MAAIRLDDGDADNIEKTLSLALVDGRNAAPKDKSITTVDPLASSTWQEVTFLLWNLYMNGSVWSFGKS